MTVNSTQEMILKKWLCEIPSESRRSFHVTGLNVGLFDSFLSGLLNQ